jgi:hypothetical protein
VADQDPRQLFCNRGAEPTWRGHRLISAVDPKATRRKDRIDLGIFGQRIPAEAVSPYCGLVIDSEAICCRWLGVAGHLDERGRRLLAAEVRAAGYGGLVAVLE